MKLEQSFSNFLTNVVNLNNTRVSVAKSGVETMRAFLKGNDLFGDYFIDIVPQGSFRQETIIKPVNSELDFDVDLLFEMKTVNGWEPKDYLLNLSGEFKKTDRYKDLVDTRGKERCVTIDYENDFHIDIVPAIKNGEAYLIMNKATKQFEITDGDGYAKWFTSRNDITGNKYLIKVTRLIKYLRDKNKNFEIKSILLTTLLGNQVLFSDNKESHYSDLPTAFLTIISRLDIFLQANQTMTEVNNPVLLTENFNRKWNQAKYAKFRDEINKIAVLARDAYLEVDESRSLLKWRKIFGDKFTGLVTSTALAVSINGLQLNNFDHKKELTDVGILSFNSSANVKINASLYWGLGNYKIINRRFKGQFDQKTELPRHHWLKYTAVTNYDKPYDVYWQVVNTGKNAERAEGLRGEIKKGSIDQWERSLYTGVHWIECFVVDRQTNICVCRSGPFYVGFREGNDDVSN